MFEFRHQPLKAAYYTYFVVSTLVIRLPYWFLTAIPAFLRPRPNWTLGRAFIVPGMRAYVGTWYATAFPPSPGQDPEQIAASGEADQLGFVWVAPLAEDLVVGEVRGIAEMQGVRPVKTCGYWYQREGDPERRDRKAGPDEKVFLHFHGGGYVTGSSHPKGGAIAPIASGLLAHCTGIARVFAGGYRISSSAPFPAKNPFPAALLDALACYHHLLHTAGFRAADVIVSGDSAGGHLALSLVRYLATGLGSSSSAALPPPGALLLLSPTVEWGVTHNAGRAASMRRNARADFCNRFFEGYTARSLLGRALAPDAAFTNAWISPASLRLAEDALEGGALFGGLPRTYVLVGDAEVCLDSYRTLRGRLAKDIGEERLTYKEMADSTHDFLTMTWHEPERTAALKDIAAWVEAL